jgi:hypothetical protein
MKVIKKLFYGKNSTYHPLYFQYMKWSFTSNIIVSIESVLGTHSMLSVIGQSSSEAIVSFNYIGKDLVGQMGSLFYLSRVGKHLDSNPKKFIKRSLIFQQLSLFLESMTPFIYSEYFIITAGVANIGKNISFTGIGAGNTQVIQKLAINNNIGEIYSHVTVLNTFGSSIGMCIGLMLIYYIPDHSLRLGLSPILAYFRILTFNKAIKGII